MEELQSNHSFSSKLFKRMNKEHRNGGEEKRIANNSIKIIEFNTDEYLIARLYKPISKILKQPIHGSD